MTVTYYPHIATVQKGVLIRLLLRWKGSLYKLVLPEIVAFLILYATLSAMYRYGLNAEQRHSFEGICIYLHEYVNSTSITFSLGFFVSFVMNRWWETFKTMPWLFTPAYVIREIIQPPPLPCESGPSGNAQPYVNALFTPQVNAQMNSFDNAAPVNNEANSATKSTANGLQHNSAPSGVPRVSPLTVGQATQFNAPSSVTTTNVQQDVPPRKNSETLPANGCLTTGPSWVDSGNDSRKKAYEDALSVRITLMRYLLLGWIFAIRRISAPVMIRFKPSQKLADASLREKLAVLNTDPFIQRYVDPLITEEEQDAIVAYAKLVHGDEADTYEPDHYVPLSWAADLVHEARQRGFVASRHLVRDLLDAFKDFRAGLGMLRLMDQFNIPLVYTQVVALSMYIYFLIVCFAQQFLDADARGGPTVAVLNASHFGANGTSETLAVSLSVTDENTRTHQNAADLYVPVPSVLYLMFLLGWLRVAEVCLNPFGEDDDDFPTWHMLNMNVETAFKILNVFELDRVYDGSLQTRRRFPSTQPTNCIAATSASQLRSRASAARLQSRRSSCASLYLRDLQNAKAHAESPQNTHELGKRLSDAFHAEQLPLAAVDRRERRDSNVSAQSDAFSCYFDEQLETIRRVNYEHLRRKYERPFYQGSALQTEMQQNPASMPSNSDLGPATLNDANALHTTSRVSAFARQLGSALHLPGIQRYASRITVTTAREGTDDNASRVLHAPLATVPSALPNNWYPNLPSGDTSRRPSDSSAANSTTVTLNRMLDHNRNNRSISNLASLPPDLRSHNAELPSPVPGSPNDPESTSLLSHGARSVSHIEMRQVGLDHSDDDRSPTRCIGRASSSSSCNSFADPERLSPNSLHEPLSHVLPNSRHNLNRIIEAAESDFDNQSVRVSSPKSRIPSPSTYKNDCNSQRFCDVADSEDADPSMDTTTAPLIDRASRGDRDRRTDSLLSHSSAPGNLHPADFEKV